MMHVQLLHSTARLVINITKWSGKCQLQYLNVHRNPTIPNNNTYLSLCNKICAMGASNVMEWRSLRALKFQNCKSRKNISQGITLWGIMEIIIQKNNSICTFTLQSAPAVITCWFTLSIARPLMRPLCAEIKMHNYYM